MNWYLIKSAYNAQPIQLMFYGDQSTYVTAMMLASQGGIAQGFIWGSNTWQPIGPASS